MYLAHYYTTRRPVCSKDVDSASPYRGRACLDHSHQQTVVHAMIYGSRYAFRMCTILDCMHAMSMTSACSVLLDLRWSVIADAVDVDIFEKRTGAQPSPPPPQKKEMIRFVSTKILIITNGPLHIVCIKCLNVFLQFPCFPVMS